MKILSLNHKRRSVWKKFLFFKKVFKVNSILLLKRNILISKFLVKKYKFCYLLNNKFLYKFRLHKKFIGFKLGQFILTKKMGSRIHLVKNKKKKKK